MVIKPNKEVYERIASIVTKHGHNVSIHRLGYICSEPGWIKTLYFNDILIKLVGGSHGINVFVYGHGKSIINDDEVDECVINDGGYYKLQSDWKEVEIPDGFLKYIENMEEYFTS